MSAVPNTELNGHKTQRLANTTNISFHGIESEALLILLDKEGICASSGSACLADSDEPSHVIKAMKPESAASRQMIRFSLDAANTADEIKKVAGGCAASYRTVTGFIEHRPSAILTHMKLDELKGIVHSDPEIMGGTPVFVGTRVPLQNLVDYLEGGESIEDFLDAFPTVKREQAIAVIEAGKLTVLETISKDAHSHR